MIEDFCKFFREIEKNPKKLIIPRPTVREYLALKNHVNGCDNCNNIVNRVCASDTDTSIPFSIN
jgi:hypothetical protein